MPPNGRRIKIRRANANGRMPRVTCLSIVCDQQPRAGPLEWTKILDNTSAGHHNAQPVDASFYYFSQQ